MLCFRCGSQVSDNASACPNCGQKFQEEKVNLAALQGRFNKVLERRKTTIPPPSAQALAVDRGGFLVPGHELAPRYIVIEQIGKATLGAVYKVKDREIDSDVALKIFPARLFDGERAKEEFARQIRKMRRLSQQNIVRIYDEGVVEGRPFYTMQLLEGMSLHKLITLRQMRERMFDLQEIEPILTQISLALQHAHRSGCHGCLKPEDILVVPDLVKIVDFGVAATLDSAQLIAELEASDNLPYLSPEQRRGEAADARSDIYSLGVILGEMLSGIRQLAPGELVSEKNPTLPPAVDKLIQRATAEKPEDRYRSVEELSEDLASLIDTGQVIGQGDLGGDAISEGQIQEAPPIPADLFEEADRELHVPRPGATSAPELTPSGSPLDPSLPAVPAQEATDHDLLIEEVIELNAKASVEQGERPRTDVLFDDGLLDAWEMPAAEEEGPPGETIHDMRRPTRPERSWWSLAFVALAILVTISIATYVYVQRQLSSRGTPTVVTELAPRAQSAPAMTSPAAKEVAASPAEGSTAAPGQPAEGSAASTSAASAAAAADTAAPVDGAAAGSGAAASAVAPRTAVSGSQAAKDEAATVVAEAGVAAVVAAVATVPVVADKPAAETTPAVPAAAAAVTTPPPAAAAQAAPPPPAAAPPKATPPPAAAPPPPAAAAAAAAAAPPPARPPATSAAAAPPTTLAAALPRTNAAAAAPLAAAPPPPATAATPARLATPPPAVAPPSRVPDWGRESLAAAPGQPAMPAWATQPAAHAQHPATAAAMPAWATAPTMHGQPGPASSAALAAHLAAAGGATTAPATASGWGLQGGWPPAAGTPGAAARPGASAVSPVAAAAPTPAPVQPVAQPPVQPVAQPPVQAVAQPPVQAVAQPMALAMAPAPPVATVIVPEKPAPAAAPAKTTCPPAMAKIQKGEFTMGAKQNDANRGFDGLARKVETDTFCIDVYEFPNRGGAPPMTGVDLGKARQLCAAQGKRLCDDREWEKACRGPRGTVYPYGANFDADACVTEDKREEARQVAPSGSFKRCRSGYGVFDMSGNVAEWTETGYIRGGSAQKADYAVQCVSKVKKSPGSRDATTGFRCCRDAM